MTALLGRSSAPSPVEHAVRRSEDLGPIAATLGSVFVVGGTLTVFRAYPYEPYVTALFGVIVFGLLLLSPANRVKRIPVSIASLGILVWLVASLEWTIDPFQTAFGLRLELPMYLGFFLIGGLLPLVQIVRGLLAAVRAAVVMTLLTVALFPWARQSGGGAGLESLEGWRGLFAAKNSMAIFMVFALIVVLVWEHRRGWRLATLGTVVLCIVGSRSATGMSGLLVTVAMYFWLRHYTRLRRSSGPAFVVTSAAVSACILTAAVFSVSSLTALYGKDLTFSGRTGVWDASVSILADRPFTGFGVRSVFVTPANDFTRALWNDIGFSVPHPHSGVLDVALQVGLIGLGLFAALFIATGVAAVQRFDTQQRLSGMILLYLVAVAILSLSESTFLGPWLAMLLLMRTLTQRTDLDVDRVWAEQPRLNRR